MKREELLAGLALFSIILLAGFVLAVGNQNNNQNQSSDINQSSNKTDNNVKCIGGGPGVKCGNETYYNKIDFSPWQKRNESECLENCSCHGAVMSCPTADGKILTIQAGASGKTIIIEINKSKVETELNISAEMEQNRTRLRTRLRNESYEIKIMPDKAHERALERLRLKVCNETNNCTIMLKNTGTESQVRLKYVVQAIKEKRFLWWHWNKQVKAEVDADTGEVSD